MPYIEVQYYGYPSAAVACRCCGSQIRHAHQIEHQTSDIDVCDPCAISWVKRKLIEESKMKFGEEVKEAAPDMVNHPPHYNKHPSGVECIDVIEWMPANIANAMKYLWRSEHKNGKQDLEKAIWYINREIKRVYDGKPSSNS